MEAKIDKAIEICLDRITPRSKLVVHTRYLRRQFGSRHLDDAVKLRRLDKRHKAIEICLDRITPRSIVKKYELSHSPLSARAVDKHCKRRVLFDKSAYRLLYLKAQRRAHYIHSAAIFKVYHAKRSTFDRQTQRREVIFKK